MVNKRNTWKAARLQLKIDAAFAPVGEQRAPSKADYVKAWLKWAMGNKPVAKGKPVQKLAAYARYLCSDRGAP